MSFHDRKFLSWVEDVIDILRPGYTDRQKALFCNSYDYFWKYLYYKTDMTSEQTAKIWEEIGNIQWGDLPKEGRNYDEETRKYYGLDKE